MLKKNLQSSVVSSRSWGAFEIALVYLLIGGLWILFSDEVAARFAPNQATFIEIRVYSDWGYILATALLLYWTIKRYSLSMSKAEQTLSESEKSYQELLQQASDGIFIADAQGNYTLVNEEACKLVGYTKAELLSMNLRELVAPEDLETRPLRLDELRAGKTLITERKLLCKDGSRIVCEISAKQLPDGRFQSIIRDITERKVTEAALQRSEQRYRSLFENMTNGFARCQMLYDGDGIPKDFIYLDVNQAFEDQTGLKNVLGKRVSTVIPGIRASNPELFEIYGRVALTGQPEKFETYVPGLGEGIWFSVSVYSTEKDFFVAVFEVITERKQAEIELRDALVNLEGAEEQAGLGSWYFDVLANKGWWSKQMYRLFELDPATGMPSNEDYLKMIHPEDRELLATTLMQMAQGVPPEKHDFRINPKPGVVRTLSPYYQLKKDQTGRVIKFSGTVLDITERTQIEAELKASEFRFRLAAESLTDVIYEWDIKEKVDWFGDVDGLMGYAPGAFPRTLTGWAALLHPDDRERVLTAVDVQLKGGAVYNLEYRVATKNGAWRWWSARGVAIRDPQGLPYHWIGSITDITARKQQDEALKESEKKYRTLHESMIDGFVSVDMRGSFVECNEVYRNMLGYSDAELAGLTYVDITPAHWHAYETEVVENQILKRGFSDVYEKEYRRKDGTIFPVELHTVLLRDEAGNPSGMWAIVRDITERKRAEAELSHSEEQYRLMFTNNPLPMWVFDRETFAFLAVNDAAVTHYGYSHEEFLQMTIKDIRPPEDIPVMLKLVATKSEPYFNIGVVRHRKKDGTLIDVETTRHDILFDGHDALIILANDVTARKQAEEKLRASEEKFRSIFEHSPLGKSLTTMTGMLRVNKAFCEIVGYSEEELKTKHWKEITHPDDIQESLDVIQLLMEGKIASITFEKRYIHKLGHLVWTEVTTALQRDENRQPLYFLTTVQDITERKRSQEEYLTIIKTAMDGFWITDSVGRFLDVNDAYCQLIGYNRQELMQMGVQDVEAVEKPEDTAQHIQKLMTTGFDKFETRHRCKNGSLVDIDVSATFQPDRGGRFYVFLRDITERKRGEEQVVYQANLLANVSDAVTASDEKFNFTAWNHAAEQMFGWKAEEVLGKSGAEVFRTEFIGVERSEVFRSVMETGVFRGEMIQYRKDGSPIYVEGNTFALRDENGNVTGYVTATRDITDRKHAEAELRQSQENFAKAFISNPAAIAITRLTDGKFISINPAYTRIMEYESYEILDHTAAEMNIYVHPEERDQLIRQLREQGTIQNYELQVRTKSGETRSIVISMQPILYNEAECILSVFLDISERKQMEAELQRSNVELEQFAYVASHDLQEPLRAVAGMVQLLQQRYQGSLDERADEYIGHAVDAATRMQSLINDLLEYSRVNRWGKALESTDTEKSLKNALTNLQIAIHESNAQITHDPLPTLMADAGQLTQLLQNLMGNAIKFRGERPLHIHIGAKKIEHTWQFQVSDNGIGIESKYYERIFLVFQRLHTRREYPGTGIGLALCKKIIERHGGQIWVESQPGLGSTFYFTIPERQA